MDHTLYRNASAADAADWQPPATKGTNPLERGPLTRNLALAPQGASHWAQPAAATKAASEDFWANLGPPAAYKPSPAQNKLSSGFDTLTTPQHSAQEGLEAVPEWVEKYSSFYTAVSPQQIIEEFLPPIFQEHCVEFQAVGNSAQCKLEAVSPGFNFMVQVFSTSNANEWVVEFQRRSGDAFGFSTFYRKALSQLGPAVTRTYMNAPQQKRLAVPDFASLNLDDLFDDAPVQDTKQQTAFCTSLCGMAKSGFVDAQREAFKEMASLPASQFVGSEELVASTLSLLYCADKVDQDCLRSGSAVLANLANNLAAPLAKQATTLKQIFVALTRPTTTLYARLAARNTVRALASMCKNVLFAKAMQKHSEASRFASILKDLSSDTDEQTRLHAQAALAAL